MEPPAAGPGRSPSRLRRALRSLRAPFHRGAAPRPAAAAAAAAASDGDLARDGRTMRKRNKKAREPAPAPDAARSTDSSPTVDKKKGFIRRMGSIGKKRAEFASEPSLQRSTKESSLESEPAPRSEPSSSHSPTPEIPTPKESTPEPPAARPARPVTPEPPTPEPLPPRTPEPEAEPPASPLLRRRYRVPLRSPVPRCPRRSPKLPRWRPSPRRRRPQLDPEPPPEPVSPIAAVHPVATRPFAAAAWRRGRRRSLPRPVEEPSPSSAARRRVTLAAQASEEGARGVGSLEEAVALARARLAPALARAARPPPRTMPAYGDLIEPSARPDPSHASASAERREHLYKILVIGELGTGKTSIIKRYVHQFFSQHYRATIGVDFALKVLNWDAHTVIRLQLWDIAGQERFGNMTRVYYKEAVGAFIVFDVSRVATFDAVAKWKNDLDSKVQLPDGSPIPCVLLANKCDQQKEGLVNSAAKMEEYCRDKGFAGWFETSAKENINIEEAARSLVNKILLNDKLLQSSDARDGEKFALEHKIANGENSRDAGGKSCNC